MVGFVGYEMILRFRGAFAALMLGGVFGEPALAQNNFVQVDKENGRFIGEVGNKAFGQPLAYDLKFQWWTLFDQFVYYHNFKWNHGGTFTNGVRVSDENGAPTSYVRSQLSDHPDLIERFDDIKPQNPEIKLGVTFYASANSLDLGKLGANCYKAALLSTGAHSASATLTLRRTPHFAVSKINKWADNITPASPQRWSDMFEFSSCLSSRGDLEKAIENTFKSASRIQVEGDLPVEVGDWLQDPRYQSIYDEWQRRLAIDEEDDADGTDDDVDTNTSSDEKLSYAEEEDDFWNGEGSIDEEAELEEEIAKRSGSEYLGRIEATSNYVTVRCRDHGEVDGDRISVLLNGNVEHENITLSGNFRDYRVPLQQGVNKLAFRALNEGTQSSNTATFMIIDANGRELLSNRWGISRGFKSTLLVIRR